MAFILMMLFIMTLIYYIIIFFRFCTGEYDYWKEILLDLIPFHLWICNIIEICQDIKWEDDI